MPLLDHFHPPLAPVRHWESFHARWTSSLADALNLQLPANYFAEPQTHSGARVEVDVATFEHSALGPAVRPQTFEVRVFHDDGGARLVGAIELASPGNKDRPDQRRAFATKCASYLYQRIGLVLVDIVTSRQANLHNEIVRVMENDAQFLLDEAAALYAVAYHPLRRGGQDMVDHWPAVLALGQPLPTLPLILAPELSVPVDLEATYVDACRRLRLP